jgi:hypothetical protein
MSVLSITPVHAAVMCGVHGLEARLDSYLEAGADIDIPCGNDASTPLMAALVSGQSGIAAYLISHGASVNQHDAASQPVSKYAVAAVGRIPAWHQEALSQTDTVELFVNDDPHANSIVQETIALLQHQGRLSILIIMSI